MRFLYYHHRQQIFLRDLVVSLKHDAVDFVLLALVDFVNQQNLLWLALKCGLDLDIEVTFFLEVVDEILLTFLYQVAVDGFFGIDRDQLFHLPSRQKWNGREAGPDGADSDHRSHVHSKGDIDTIGLSIVLRCIFANAAG